MSIASVDTSSVGLNAPGLLRPTAPPSAPDSAHGPAHAKASGPNDGPDTALTSQDTASTAAALQDQIRAAREQLNDWVTCVSATTPQGKAEIRSLSTQISAAEEQIDHLPQITASDATSAAGNLDLWA